MSLCHLVDRLTHVVGGCLGGTKVTSQLGPQFRYQRPFEIERQTQRHRASTAEIRKFFRSGG